VTGAPSIYEVDVAHVRAAPVRHDVRHRSYLWFVDLDDLPRHGRLASFRAADHLGDPHRTLRENVDAYLAANGVDLHGGRITMLTGARSLGYVFNPLTLFWCHDRTGAVVCVVAEVHNTYGQRHRYLLRPDDAGRAEVAKEFYVSPFYPVDGYYRMSVREPDERLAVTITLHRPNSPPFTASVRGVRRPATRRAVVATALRHPFETWVVRALITKHGIALWRKGLPVRVRPPHPSDPEVRMPAKPTVAERLATLVHDTVGLDLPVRIRAWDGASSGVRLTARGRAKAALTAARLGAIGAPPKPPASEARLTGRVHSRRRDLICRKLDLKPGMRLLDVGCGWGSPVLHAAEHYGVQATGITLSALQRDLIAKRIADRGLDDRVEVRLQDYREFGETGETFDAVSSIEMGEHVGEGQYPTYVGILYGALKPTGRLLLQQMSRRHDAAPGGGAFIEAYFAPDMHMRPMSRTLHHLESAGFEIRDVEAMREHYARTVEAWTDTFEANWDAFVALQGEEVARVWRLYLVGGALTSFEEGRTGVDQFLAVKATTEGWTRMPPTRAWAVSQTSA
jgi:cyclopropane-fatty-acyl-phospholipid synthase